MENQTRWVASWEDREGRQRVYIFRGPDSRLQARIELSIRVLDMHEPLPLGYELTEAETGIPPTPVHEEIKLLRGIPRRSRLVSS